MPHTISETDTRIPSAPERLFFALPLDIPAENSSAFHQLRQLLQMMPGEGRPVPAANLHLTLAFLGNVSAAQKTQLCQLADPLEESAFTLTTTALKYQKRSRLIWLSCTLPAPLAQLAENLKAIAEQVGLPQETRPYSPHITLLKHLRARPDALPEIPPLAFHIRHFGLYISELFNSPRGGGVHYRCLKQWPLTPAPPDHQEMP
ncbi:RNA 2',3'-cyclic phosphodiesterase [Photobacterium sp. TY1-4]|uniref:RNA 2',3'-cyclic phosphodiesterase n=1 Tax=Photobacterium sp. TY1-4 TaxID=2899122 RepID=UPI0021BFDB15|nr:RNA 2',3'-cyclic phosphodiesterase [Photobacterium sp. TY1-4]UXI01684.1 RNA 2',3'-cyclic phosphodiesterase [Photobacterium sp. TY1-4]